MVRGILRAALVLQFLWLISEVAAQSPCPNYFRYARDEETNEIIGIIDIPSPPRGIALHLSVGMSISVALPTKYVGRLELAQSREESVRAVQQGRPLRYRIHFPLRQPTPLLTGLWFNNKQVCAGPRAMGPVVTSIVLNHTLYPPGVIPLSEGQGNDIPTESKLDAPPIQPQYQPIDPFQPDPYQPESYEPDSYEPPEPYRPPAPQFYPQPQPIPQRPKPQPPTQPPPTRAPTRPPTRPTVRPIIRPTPRPAPLPVPVPVPVEKPRPHLPFPVPSDDSNEVCGRSANVNNLNLLIVRGTKTVVGQWPWLAAIFVVRSEFEFQCAGTLVTNTHVISAAHCFKLDNQNILAGTFLVSLGRYRLRDWREKGSLNREVSDYRVHPDYKSGGSADADLAIVVLRERVEYSATIKPICLWTSGPSLEDVVGKFGYVVGWGQDENGSPYLQEPRMTREPVVAQEVCLWSNAYFVSFTSNRTLCAGSRNGSGPCNGDSGSGLVIQDPRTGRYHLRGVVSLSLLGNNSMTCDLSQYIVYVDVAKHMEWVQQQIAT